LKKGFSPEKIPVIVFWNLNARYANSPFDPHQNKIISLSGFNQALLKNI
jgi:hypothetical protein